MNIVLIGAVDSTRVALECLLDYGTPPSALLTLPLSRSSRHSDFVDLRPLAAEHNIKVIETANVNRPEVLAQLRELDPDYLMVIGWSQILREGFFALDAQLLGYHPALIPENRGRAVLPWTILQRQRRTGATLFWLDRGVDSGDILVQRELALRPDETVTTLYAKQLELLRELMATALPLLESGSPPRQPQPQTGASYCAKRTADDGLIDWRQNADEVWTLIRAVSRPYPGAFTFYKGEKLVLWEATLVGEAPYWGLPGQVQQLSADGALIQCGDRQHILVSEVETADGIRTAQEVLKVHDHLGINWLGLYASLSRTQETHD